MKYMNNRTTRGRNFSESKEYDDYFRSELEKTGKGIDDMSDAEKKEFFNKIDRGWKAKNENSMKRAIRNIVREELNRFKTGGRLSEVNYMAGEYVFYYTRMDGTVVHVKTFNTGRAAKMFMKKYSSSYLNKPNIKDVGTVHISEWNDFYADYAEYE